MQVSIRNQIGNMLDAGRLSHRDPAAFNIVGALTGEILRRYFTEPSLHSLPNRMNGLYGNKLAYYCIDQSREQIRRNNALDLAYSSHRSSKCFIRAFQKIDLSLPVFKKLCF